MHSEPEIKEKEDAVDFEFKSGDIEFQNVSFSHNEEKKEVAEEGEEQEAPAKLLDNFSMKIEAGTSNAIVGPSGFGKTTMFNLMMRLYDPIEGSVKLDG